MDCYQTDRVSHCNSLKNLYTFHMDQIVFKKKTSVFVAETNMYFKCLYNYASPFATYLRIGFFPDDEAELILEGVRPGGDFRLLFLDPAILDEILLASSSSTDSNERLAFPSSHLFTCEAKRREHKVSEVLS